MGESHFSLFAQIKTNTEIPLQSHRLNPIYNVLYYAKNMPSHRTQSCARYNFYAKIGIIFVPKLALFLCQKLALFLCQNWHYFCAKIGIVFVPKLALFLCQNWYNLCRNYHKILFTLVMFFGKNVCDFVSQLCHNYVTIFCFLPHWLCDTSRIICVTSPKVDIVHRVTISDIFDIKIFANANRT